MVLSSARPPIQINRWSATTPFSYLMRPDPGRETNLPTTGSSGLHRQGFGEHGRERQNGKRMKGRCRGRREKKRRGNKEEKEKEKGRRREEDRLWMSVLCL